MSCSFRFLDRFGNTSRLDIGKARTDLILLKKGLRWWRFLFTAGYGVIL